MNKALHIIVYILKHKPNPIKVEIPIDLCIYTIIEQKDNSCSV